MTASVHLKSQSQPIEFIEVKNTYTKDGLYCVYTTEGLVHKFPVLDIFKVVESYSK